MPGEGDRSWFCVESEAIIITYGLFWVVPRFKIAFQGLVGDWQRRLLESKKWQARR